MDVLGLYRGGQSWRGVRIFIEHLPPETATKTAMRLAAEAEGIQPDEDASPADAPHSALEMSVIALRDDVRYLTYVVQASNGGKGKPPEPLERPGVRSKKNRRLKPVEGAMAEHLFRRINAA